MSNRRSQWSWLDSLRIEHRPLASAVAAERAFLANGVGPLEDPVLPCRQPREYFRFHRLRSAEPEIGLKAGQSVRRKAGALLKEQAQLVVPIDVVERKGHEAKRLGGLAAQHLSALGFRAV